MSSLIVPFSHFCGVWSFVDCGWLVTPEPAELRRRNDYTSDIDLAMHVCHHQLYWEKKNENEQDGFTWTRSEYVEYVAEQIEKVPVVSKFFGKPQYCKIFSECGSAEAMFWCHPCGFAYCLECRTCGLACNHSIVNFSSELSADFMPDSIGSSKSLFDIEEFVDAVLAESSYFGATRSEHAQNRQEKFSELITHLREGRSMGNTYLQSFARHGIEDFDYTEYIYEMPFGSRIPSLQQHFVDAQDQTPLPIWRPKAFFKYPDGGDLQEGEILRLLELFRSCLLGKRACCFFFPSNAFMASARSFNTFNFMLQK